VADPAEEHATLHDMVSEYADVVRRTVGRGPVHLMGWSLGGLLALSVAQSLVATGTEVLSLHLWDTGWSDHPTPDQSTPGARTAAYLAVLNALPIPAHIVARVADTLGNQHEVGAQEWLDHLAQAGALEKLRLSSQDLDHAVALTLRHRSLIRDWTPSALNVPVHALWAADSLALRHVTRVHWGQLTGAPFTDEVVPGDHYSIVRQPAIDGLAEQLRLRLQRMSGPAPDPKHLHTAQLQ
jgi:thioesterase domain-containing protein